MSELSTSEVLARRLTNLRLSRPGTSAAELADWFGAMQAQDLASGKWSLGVRLPGSTEADIDDALAAGEVMRTWPMRGTIHIVHPANAHWLLDLTGVRALNGVQKRWDNLKLDKSTVDRAAGVLATALRGKRLTRAECLAALEDAGIDTAGGRAYHLLWHTAQIGITCIGPNQGSEQTFVLLDEWAPRPRNPVREEALAMLATRYFRSHGPTTRADFQGWTGLTATDAKQAVAAADLDAARFQGKEVFFVDGEVDDPQEIMLLPGFDEFLLGYKDRSAFLDREHADFVVPGGNGMFKATVVRRGKVIGTWQRKMLTRKVQITITGFARIPAKARKAVEAPAARYADFVDKDLELVFA
ncbi:MAG: winged helix DNA-binding domain-containing protein [Candidatus Nanopelagicales bacterium]